MTSQGGSGFSADIRWTTHGVAHITAEDWGGLGYGQGFACARDHLPTLADQIVKVRSERSRFHGPGPEDAHLASDFGYLALGVAERAPAFRDAQPPEIHALVAGFTAGYNRALGEALDAGSLPAWCQGAEWIRPIDEIDLYTYMCDVALMGSGRILSGIVGRAEAPGPDGPRPASPVSALGSVDTAPPGSSNGWAFGGDVTASGHGIVMANPHFPWAGEARFWECHLTIPGELDVYGVSLLGTPGVQMGFNAHVAWAHTFSKGHRFTISRLDLVPGRPTSYRHGVDERDMEPRTFGIEVADGEGGLRTVERTLWSTHHGPMVNLPLLGWGLDTAYTYRDANLDNTAVVGQFLGMDRATSMDEFQAVYENVQGLPWVNTLAADRTGRAWYIDGSATPNISPDAQRRFRERVASDPLAAVLLDNKVALLDGSDPGDDWVEDPGARSPGIVAHRHLPQVERRDFVLNANDSHWMPNPATPLEGYSVLHGFERTPLSLRTRQNLAVVQHLADTGGLTTGTVITALLDNAGLGAELLAETVAKRAGAAGSVNIEGDEVDLTLAARVLGDWDGRADLSSVGAALWREFMAGFPLTDHRDEGGLFGVPFDPDDPVGTPRELAPEPEDGPDPIVVALGRAVLALDRAGVPVDAPLGEVQWADRGPERVPVHGGGEGEGILNVVIPEGLLPRSSLEPGPPPLEVQPGRTERTGLTAGGYRCSYGTSFLMAVELTNDGPKGIGLMTYGQSGDPRSPHHADGTRAFSAKELRPLRFSDADIEADPELTRLTITST